MPKVSIIIPVYNNEKYLKECIDSCINQTLQDIEIICIDDKSTDNSLKILKEYSLKDNRIIIIQQEINQGQGVVKNCGLCAAKGEYVMFLDSDDWYEIDTCEKAYNKIKELRTDICLFEHFRYSQNQKNKKICNNMLTPFLKYINNEKIDLDIVEGNYIKSALMTMYIYDINFLKKHNIAFSDNRIGEDVVFMSQVLLYAKTLCLIREPLYNYRILEIKDKGKGSSYDTKAWISIFVSREKALENILLSDNKNLHSAYCIYYIKTILNWYYRYTKIDKSIRKKYYNKMHNAYNTINKNCCIEDIKEYIDINSFKKIKNRSWFILNLLTFLNKMFSVYNETNPGKKYKVIKIMGLKFKFRMHTKH